MTEATMEQLLALPPLAGGRPRATALVLGSLPADLHGASVVVDCRDLMASSESFADQLVIEVLLQRGATLMEIVNVDSETGRWFDTSASDHQVSDRLRVDRVG